MIDFSIIIPAKNEAHNIGPCLASILEAVTEGVSYEILLMDNGSQDRTVEIAKGYGAKVEVLPDATISGLRNRGAVIAQGRILAFLDADCTVLADWFSQAQRYLERDDVPAFGSPPVIPEQATWVQRSWFVVRQKSPGIEIVEWLESMNLFIRCEAFKQVGGFDESLATCEDYDLSLRLRKLGDIVSDGRIRAIHHGEAENLAHFYRKERWRGVSNLAGVRQHGLTLSELPSLVLPLIQIFTVVIMSLGLVVTVLAALPITWYLTALACWQIPLLLMSVKKGWRRGTLTDIAGVYILLNIYFTARGQSMFSVASWRKSKAH